MRFPFQAERKSEKVMFKSEVKREREREKFFNWIYGQRSAMVPARLHRREITRRSPLSSAFRPAHTGERERR